MTYAESLAMIIRALGYEPTLKGSWPTKYLIKAAELDISKGVAVNANAPALRGDVAVFVDNSLTVPKVIQVGFGDEAKYVVSGTPDYPTEETLLSKNLGFNKIEGRVVNNSFTDSDLDEDEIELSDGKIYTLPEGTGALALLGLEVKVWADDDRNIAAYEVKTEADKVIYDTVAADATNDKVELKVKDKEYSWATDPSVYVNFDAKAKTDVDAGMYGRFVLDSKGKVAFACVFKFDLVNAGLVTESSESKVKYLQVASKKEIKFSNYEDGVYIFGPQLSSLKVEDIKADSVIYGWADGDKLYLIVAGDKAEGELSTATSSKVTLAGKKYNLSEVAKTYSEDNDETVSAISDPENLENLLGENVVAILDINGDVRHIRGEAAAVSGLQFGIALNGSPAGLDTPAKIKILTKDGETVIYALEDADDYPADADWKVTDNGVNDKDTTLDNTPVAFKLNADGEIAKGELYFDLDEIVGISSSYGQFETALNPTINKDDDLITSGSNSAYVTSATAIFSAIKDVADKDVKALSWADIESMNTTDVKLQVVKKIGDAVLVYFTAGYDTIAVGEKYGVVLASPWLTSDGWKVKVDVFGEGEKEYLLSDNGDRGKFKEGDAIKFTLDAKGKIKAPEAGATKSGAVADISGSYVKINGNWIRVADNAVMYKLDEDNKIDVAITVGDLAEDDTINYVLDKNGKIAALVKVQVQVVTYSLTTSVTGQGTVTVNPQGPSYAAGTVVTLTAVPATGWEFSHWTGDVTGSANPTTVTMNANKSVTAVFTEIPAYELGLSASQIDADTGSVKIQLTNNTSNPLTLSNDRVLYTVTDPSNTSTNTPTTATANIFPGATEDLVTVSSLNEAGVYTIKVWVYDDDTLLATDTLSLTVVAGAVNAAQSTVSVDPPLALNTTSTVTVTAKDQYGNVVEGYTFKIDVTVTDASATTDESYTIDGTAYTDSATDVNLTSATNASGQATFNIVIPATVDAGDGVSVQVQLVDGTTNVGTALTFSGS